MRRLIKYGIVLLTLGVVVAVGLRWGWAYWKERSRPQFEEAAILRGEIVSVVNSTGTIQPLLRVTIGSFISGPVEAIFVDYNSKVRKGDLMARIDPRICKAAVARDEATLATAKADVARVKALRQQAINDLKRAEDLRRMNKDYISDTVMDQYKFNRLSLQAQLEVAEASVGQAEGNLQNSRASLSYTDIRSPVDGIVIDRKIDRGQTLAAQFTTPEMFIVAPDMEKEMYVYGSVDEADIGLIREAQHRNDAVEFTVSAYPEDLFKGTIYQIRMNFTTEQNVVTYPVVVKAPNPQMKLMPGMTANLSFRVGQRKGVLKIPNAALRFYPKPEQVRKEDRDVLEGKKSGQSAAEDDSDRQPSAAEKAEAGKKRHARHVWVVEKDLLKAVEVTTGLSDSKFTELVRGELKEGQKLVTGVKKP